VARAYRSRRARLSALSAQLRADGQTWAQIARHIQDTESVNTRIAMRLAHGFTQSQVALRWNDRWPSDSGTTGITDKHISYWETWPQSGHEPSLKSLKRLAQLYQCDVGDLIDDGNYSHLDDAKEQPEDVGVSDAARQEQGTVPPQATEQATVASLARRENQLPDELSPLAFIAGQAEPEDAARLLAPLQRLAQLVQQQNGTPLEREVLYEQLVQFLATWADSMKRRELLRVLAWAATAAAATPLFPGLNLEEQERVVQVVGGRHRIDERIIGHIESVLWSAMRQDDALGPQAALDTVLAQRNLLRAVLPECHAALRPRLLSLFSNLSRFAGWLSFDLSDFDSAAYYYEQARTAAHEAEDTELGVFVLCNMSHLATWRGQPRVGIDHAVAAGAWAKETGDQLLGAYAADVAARAYAKAGRQRACLEALSTIPRNLDGAPAHTPATSLVYFYSPAQYAMNRAHCLLLLHDAKGTAESAQEALRLVDPSFVRNQAFGTLHLGNAHIQRREIEAAASRFSEAADLAARNRSARVVDLLLRSRSRLDPWQHSRPVKELDERLAAYGWGRNAST
jgi:transcriptional regulator with XRE-family HTH domain